MPVCAFVSSESFFIYCFHDDLMLAEGPQEDKRTTATKTQKVVAECEKKKGLLNDLIGLKYD
jgi:hypothetical protein